MDLRTFIRDIPDFPEPGVLFRDITPLLGHPQALAEALDWFTSAIHASDADAIVAIESRGFIFGAPVAARLQLPFVPVRKPGKLPAARMSFEYSLEYGSSQLDIHQDALSDGARVAIVDDLLATGGTAAAAAKLVELAGGRVVLFTFLVELSELNGRSRLQGYRTESLIPY